MTKLTKLIRFWERCLKGDTIHLNGITRYNITETISNLRHLENLKRIQK